MAYTNSQKNATLKYLKTLKEIRFRVKQDEYLKYINAQENSDYNSLRSFIISAIEEKIKRES